MNRQKVNLTAFLLYQAFLIVMAGLIVILGGEAWGDLFLSENLIVPGVLFLSAVAVEALPVRWTATQYTTLIPMVLLLILVLTRAPVLAVAVSGVGAFVGYGLLRELRVHFRQMPGRAMQRTLFYTAQSVVAAAIAGGLYSLLLDSIPTSSVLDVIIGFGFVIVYILLSRSFVSAYNWLVSFLWPGDIPLPTPNLLVFLVTAIAPVIIMWLYQTVPESSDFLVELLGKEGVRSLVILFVWPLALLIFFIASPYLTIGVESEEIKKDYVQFFRYSERMLDVAGVVELVTKEMRAEFGCDDCIVYSWNDKKRTYELEKGLGEGQSAPRESAETIPDIGWPKSVEPAKSIIGEAVEGDKPGFFQGRDARDFLESVGLPCPESRSVLVIPLRYAREGSSNIVRVGFVVLVKRRGTFTHSDRVRAGHRMSHRTAAHIGLRQARLYRDAQRFFAEVNKGVSRSGEVLAATQALFAKGIDPAIFLAKVSRGAQDRALVRVVESISQGRFPEETDEILDEEGIERLYKQIKGDDPNLPELTSEIKEDIRAVTSSLSLSFAIPYRWPSPEYGEIPSEMRDLYSLFLRALEANTIDEILAFGVKLNDRERLKLLARDFPEAVKEFSSLQKVIQAIKLSQDRESDDETRADHLSAALRMLAPEVGKEPRSGEQLILAQIRDSWATVIYNKREELLGPSDLTMHLETQAAIVTAEGIVISLRVGNRGKSLAEDVALRIAESDEYEIRDPAKTSSLLGELEPGQSCQLSFKIHPKRDDFVRLAFEATWNDRLRAGRTMSYANRVNLRPAVPVFVHIENPYVPGPPLKPGSGMFFGRKDAFEFARNNIGTRGQHNVLILTGQRRTGKTSLALRLAEELDRDRHVVAYVDGQALGTESGTDLFLRDLSWMICDGLEDYDIECAPLSLEDSGRGASERFEREFLPQAFSAIGERSLILVFDEFEELEDRVKKGKVDAAIFKFLRHLMQHTPNLVFVFIGTHRLQELSQDYWSIFFDFALHKKIGFLDEEAARRLIAEPPEQDILDPYAVNEIIRLTAGHPYFLQLLCHYMVDFRNRSCLQPLTLQHVRDAIPDLLVQAEGHLTSLWLTATPIERTVMASASRVLARQDTVRTSDLVEQLAVYRVEQPPQDILSAEEALAAREIFERLEGEPPSYRFKVELIRRWIERNQPLSLVVGKLS